MDYEKKYKEAVARMKRYVKDEYGCTRLRPEAIFPELAESEDERIVKELLTFFRESIHGGHILTNKEYDSWIAWLEKQGEQKPDNELKFEIGDLITNGILVGKIDEIHELGYHAYFGGHYADVPDVENWHKWTIQDAKDGDVLSYREGQWCFIYKEIVTEDTFKYYALLSKKGITLNNAAFSLLSSCITPATKKQRDTLIKAMADAGYTFDFEKKELKKIEQKPAWSEEDEVTLDTLIANYEFLCKKYRDKEHDFFVGMSLVKEDLDMISWLKSLKDRVQPQPKQEWSEEDENILEELLDYCNTENARWYNWLKSLRPQNTWKPSDEQMKALHAKLSYVNSDRELVPDVILESLYNDLKKLREE